MMSTCSYKGCEKKRRAGGLCKMHYTRYKRYGDPARGRILNEEPAYSAVHERLRTQRGKATQYLCVGCEAPALEWACRRNKTIAGKAPDGSPVMYSYSTDDYDPLCRACHRTLDAGATRGSRNPLAKLTEEIVQEIRSRVTAGEYVSSYFEAKRLGVSRGTVQNVISGTSWKHVKVDE